MVLFPLINLLLSQGKSAGVLWLVAGARAPREAGLAPVVLPGAVGLHLDVRRGI